MRFVPKRMKFTYAILLVTFLILQITFRVWSQGVAVPHRVARPLPNIKIDIPLPKVRFEDIAAKAGVNGHPHHGRDGPKIYPRNNWQWCGHV